MGRHERDITDDRDAHPAGRDHRNDGAVVPARVAIARVVLHGVLPCLDLARRVQVRRHARDLATRAPLPTDQTAMTGLDYTQLALLRSL